LGRFDHFELFIFDFRDFFFFFFLFVFLLHLCDYVWGQTFFCIMERYVTNTLCFLMCSPLIIYSDQPFQHFSNESLKIML
jgi:hypothetical protein